MTRSTNQRRGNTASTASSSRYQDLKRMLETRQEELAAAVRGRIRDVRADSSDPSLDVCDDAESSQIGCQADLDFALIELKAETLDRVTAALAHLEAGTYGRCLDCGYDIAEARLRALPFASRCWDCEDTRERTRPRERASLRPRASLIGFSPDPAGR